MSNFNTRPRFQDRDVKQLSGDTITLSGETNINGVFRYLPGATTGYVITSDDANGTFSWQPSGAGSFTGNTSGGCITDIFVTNIHSCSPLNINPLNEGNVYFGSTSGITIDVINNRLGINNPTPLYTLDISGTTGEKLEFQPSGTAPRLLLSVNQSNRLNRVAVIDATNTTGIEMGFRGSTEPSFPGYGKQGDSFIRAGNNSNGLNIIEAPTAPFENYIRFFAGQNANTTPDIHIQGSGSTRGFVGINNATPTERLDVVGKTKTTNFQMTNGATNGYVLTSDSLGNGGWQPSYEFTGNTSGNCITDLYITNLYGCSPITVHDDLELIGKVFANTGNSELDLTFQGDDDVIFLGTTGSTGIIDGLLIDPDQQYYSTHLFSENTNTQIKTEVSLISDRVSLLTYDVGQNNHISNVSTSYSPFFNSTFTNTSSVNLSGTSSAQIRTIVDLTTDESLITLTADEIQVNGDTNIVGSLSATTFYGDGSNLAGIKPDYINYFEFTGNTVTNIVSSGTWYKLNTNSTTSLFSRGDLVHTNNKVTYTGTTPKVFQIEGIVSISAGNNNEIHASFFKNNSLYPCSEQSTVASSGGRSGALPFHCVIELQTNDYLEVFVKNQSSTTNITLSNVNVIIKEL